MPTLSNTRVDRAGRALRDWWGTHDWPRENRSWTTDAAVLLEFRSRFQNPLKKTTVGVRQFVQRETLAPRLDPITGRPVLDVGQRLKRAPQMLNKLLRHPTMRLSQMDDVAGCRAILDTRGEISGVIRRMRRNSWDIVRIDDYIAEPKSTGYRAIHVIVRRDGKLIEIQLRTRALHEWAEAVDRTALRLDRSLGKWPHGLKDGHGPADLLEYFKQAAYAIAREEEGNLVGPEFDAEFAKLREKVRPYFDRT